MKEISLGQLRPFVRFARLLDADIKKFPDLLCAGDCRLFYCTGGRGEIRADGKSYEMQIGTLIYLAPGIPYSYFRDPEEPMKLLAFNFDLVWDRAELSVPFPPVRAETFSREEIVAGVTLREAPVLSGVLMAGDCRYLYGKLSEIHMEFSSAKVFYEQRCSGLMLAVLTQLLPGVGDVSGRKQAGIVDAVIDYIGSNYSSQITNRHLGERFGYHPNYLNQLFLRYTGKQLHQYLQETRVMKAIALLQETGLSVAEVANMVGFRDVPHFSRYFKKKTGYSPSDFR